MINEPVDASLYKYPWIISSKLFSTTLFLLSLSAVKIFYKLKHVARQMSINIRFKLLIYLTFIAHAQKHFGSKQLAVTSKQYR